MLWPWKLRIPCGLLLQLFVFAARIECTALTATEVVSVFPNSSLAATAAQNKCHTFQKLKKARLNFFSRVIGFCKSPRILINHCRHKTSNLCSKVKVEAIKSIKHVWHFTCADELPFIKRKIMQHYSPSLVTIIVKWCNWDPHSILRDFFKKNLMIAKLKMNWTCDQ